DARVAEGRTHSRHGAVLLLEALLRTLGFLSYARRLDATPLGKPRESQRRHRSKQRRRARVPIEHRPIVFPHQQDRGDLAGLGIEGRKAFEGPGDVLACDARTAWYLDGDATNRMVCVHVADRWQRYQTNSVLDGAVIASIGLSPHQDPLDLLFLLRELSTKPRHCRVADLDYEVVDTTQGDRTRPGAVLEINKAEQAKLDSSPVCHEAEPRLGWVEKDLLSTAPLDHRLEAESVEAKAQTAVRPHRRTEQLPNVTRAAWLVQSARIAAQLVLHALLVEHLRLRPSRIDPPTELIEAFGGIHDGVGLVRIASVVVEVPNVQERCIDLQNAR